MGVVEKFGTAKPRPLFRIGDKVSLCSGGASMTVIGILDGDYIEVVWMDGSAFKRERLPSDSLVL
jgi:uncharacterized protein YodC (DUF2158 family)